MLINYTNCEGLLDPGYTLCRGCGEVAEIATLKNHTGPDGVSFPIGANCCAYADQQD